MTPHTENPADVLYRLLLNIKDQHAPTETIDMDTIISDYQRGLVQRLRIEHSPYLNDALESYLSTISHTLRPRSVEEYSTYIKRLLREAPRYRQVHVGGISPGQCTELLRVYPTAAGRNKARRILHSFFEYAIENGWTEHNPLNRIATEAQARQQRRHLTLPQLQRLFRAALQPNNRSLSICIGLLLWQQLRLSDISRLRWETLSHHSLQAPVRRLLSLRVHPRTGAILPPDWRSRWLRLRREAGLLDFDAADLRHTGLVCRQICLAATTAVDTGSGDTLTPAPTYDEAAAIMQGDILLTAADE